MGGQNYVGNVGFDKNDGNAGWTGLFVRGTDERTAQTQPAAAERESEPLTPPVNERKVYDLITETVGDQGDGIVKVERSYVVIVPGAQLSDETTVEIEQVKQSVAFASVVKSNSRFL